MQLNKILDPKCPGVINAIQDVGVKETDIASLALSGVDLSGMKPSCVKRLTLEDVEGMDEKINDLSPSGHVSHLNTSFKGVEASQRVSTEVGRVDSVKNRKKPATWKNCARTDFVTLGMKTDSILEMPKRKEGPDLSLLDNIKHMKTTEADCNEAGTTGQSCQDKWILYVGMFMG